MKKFFLKNKILSFVAPLVLATAVGAHAGPQREVAPAPTPIVKQQEGRVDAECRQFVDAVRGFWQNNAGSIENIDHGDEPRFDYRGWCDEEKWSPNDIKRDAEMKAALMGGYDALKNTFDIGMSRKEYEKLITESKFNFAKPCDDAEHSGTYGAYTIPRIAESWEGGELTSRKVTNYVKILNFNTENFDFETHTTLHELLHVVGIKSARELDEGRTELCSRLLAEKGGLDMGKFQSADVLYNTSMDKILLERVGAKAYFSAAANPGKDDENFKKLWDANMRDIIDYDSQHGTKTDDVNITPSALERQL